MSRVGKKKVYFIAYYFVLLDNNELMRDITQKMWWLPEYLQEQLFKKKAVSFMSEQTWQIISFLTFKLYSPGAFDRYYVWFVLNVAQPPFFPPLLSLGTLLLLDSCLTLGWKLFGVLAS